mgnify:CR=1 FL=1
MRSIPSTARVRAWSIGRSAGWAVLAAAHFAWGAEDPGARSLHQHQLQRQRQQESLQLRMHQQQRSVQYPSADARQKRAVEQLQVNQQVQQQQLHYRQEIEPPRYLERLGIPVASACTEELSSLMGEC